MDSKYTNPSFSDYRPKANLSDWIEGARVRTLPAALAPVALGTMMAAALGAADYVSAALALGVALTLQIGVNFANDYSDGIRGTDDRRVGPQRLTGSGLVPPRTVLKVSLAHFAVSTALGVALLARSGDWWLLVAGAAAIIAAWFYTGGKKPYGYHGLGEVMVIIFFGYMATLGTLWTQAHQCPGWAWLAATGVGLLSADLLMVNNIRDLPTDALSGKRTLAVRLGDARARRAFMLIMYLGVFCSPLTAVWLMWLQGTASGVVLLISGLPVFVVPLVSAGVRTGATTGLELVKVLRKTGLLTLYYAACAGVAVIHLLILGG